MPSDCILFAIRPHRQAIYYQVAPSDSSVHFAPNPYPNTALLHHQKSRILNPSKKSNRAFSFLSSLPVASDDECLRAISGATNFSCKGVKQTPKSLALLRPTCRVAWPCYRGSSVLVLTPRAKHYLRPVLFHRLSSICKTMRLFGFHWIQTRKN